MLLLFFASQAALSQSDVRLRVETNSFSRIPVELKNCTTRKQASVMEAARVLDILDNDLWMSSVIASYRTDEQLAGQNSPWLELAARGSGEPFRLTVQPEIEIESNSVTFAAKLRDGRSQLVLADKSYRGCRDNLRLLVHALADDIVETLTGQKGIAQSRIVFTAQLLQGKELFIVDYDGTNQQQLTQNGSLNLTPAWSVDGRTVAFTTYQFGLPDLLLADVLSGKPVEHLKLPGLQTAPVWSPDGKRLALVSSHEGNAEIYSMNEGSTKLRRLTFHPLTDTSPSWSPTGRELVFTSDRLGSPQLFIMDAEGGNARRLTTTGEYNDSPAWSPRGDKIAYVSRLEGRFQILTIDVTGENVVQLTASGGTNEDPSWSPDGYRLVFSSTREGKSDLYSMEWNGENVRRMTHRGLCTSPAWSANVRPKEFFDCKK
ncbi:MAG: Tol-Pal system beta propeller repeat protein TolB [bacterium]